MRQLALTSNVTLFSLITKRQISLTHMNFNTFKEFRQELYECFSYSRDALFNLADALLTETAAHSVIELLLSPFLSGSGRACMRLCKQVKLTRPSLNEPWLTLPLKRGLESGWSWLSMPVISNDPSVKRRLTGATSTCIICPNVTNQSRSVGSSPRL